MGAELPLDRLQRWMQGVITHEGDVADALTSPEVRSELPPEQVSDVLLPSKTLTPVERLAIYHDMYPLRMYDTLVGDYPGLEHFLGHGAFHDLVRAYTEVHPSRSYSLNRLGDHLPEFVKSAAVRRPEFCHELARLELAVTHVFDEEETPRLTEAAIASVPPEAWEQAVLRPVAAFRLLSFRYPVNTYLQTVKDDDHDHPKARRKDEWVAVYRRDYGVYRLGLARAAHDLLADLVAGIPLGEAIAGALQAGGKRAPSETELFRWFREWVSGGIFSTVEIREA
jgi:putative DNA-binding protein